MDSLHDRAGINIYFIQHMPIPVCPRGMLFPVETDPPFKEVGVPYSGLHMIEEYFANDNLI